MNRGAISALKEDLAGRGPQILGFSIIFCLGESPAGKGVHRVRDRGWLFSDTSLKEVIRGHG